jgi:hypothetical protein
MTITLELSPEIEARIAEQAQAQGMPVKDYLQAKVEELASPQGDISETALLSESALAKDWLRPEEDDAWRDL